MSVSSQGVEAFARYPKRQRAVVSYNDTIESEEFGGNADDNASFHDFDDDEDWHISKKQKQQSKALARKPRKSKKKSYFAFMGLPAEMRNEIYKIVVISADNIVSLNSANLSNSNIRRFLVPLGYHGPKHRFARAFRNLRLLRVSKEIYKEAAHLFYKQTFQFHSAATLQTFLLQQRSETMSRLRHIDVTVAENEWNLVPGVSAQLAELVNIEKLSIHGLNHKTSGRDFPKHLSQTGRSISEWDLSLESYDKALGIKLARDTYPFLFPFYRKVIHDRGVDQLLAILDMHVCERVRTVWHSIGWALWRREQPLITRYKDVAETEERRKVRDAAVGEEIIRLLVSDC